jgi:hypothetical protein
VQHLYNAQMQQGLLSLDGLQAYEKNIYFLQTNPHWEMKEWTTLEKVRGVHTSHSLRCEGAAEPSVVPWVMAASSYPHRHAAVRAASPLRAGGGILPGPADERAPGLPIRAGGQLCRGEGC